MKSYLFITAALFLAASVVPPIHAQQANRTAGSTSAAASIPADVPRSKVAIIDTEAFYDQQNGITRLVNAMKGVDQEFQPRKTELQSMQQRIGQLDDEINKTSSVADTRSVQQKSDQLEQLKREYQRKGEDAQAAYSKRLQEIISPIYDDLNKAIKAYAEQRGIVLILDPGKLEGAIIYAIASSNVTRDFITEYNRRNPAAASPR